MWSLHVVTLAPLYDSSPEESLCVPIEFLAIECTSIEVLVVVKVVVSVMKLNHLLKMRPSVAATDYKCCSSCLTL